MTVAAGGPSFVLSGPTGTVAAHGIGTAFADIDEARAALQRGQVPIVVGALPFDTTGAAALHAPKQLSREPLLPPRQADPPPPRLLEASPQPDPGTHRDRVAAAVARLRADGSSLHKVVLARALRLHADAPWDPSVVLRRLLAADPGAYGYLVDLSPAGPRYAGVTLVGASPSCWWPAPARWCGVGRSPVRRRARPTRRSTAPTGRRWWRRPRTATSISW